MFIVWVYICEKLFNSPLIIKPEPINFLSNQVISTGNSILQTCLCFEIIAQLYNSINYCTARAVKSVFRRKCPTWQVSLHRTHFIKGKIWRKLWENDPGPMCSPMRVSLKTCYIEVFVIGIIYKLPLLSLHTIDSKFSLFMVN